MLPLLWTVVVILIVGYAWVRSKSNLKDVDNLPPCMPSLPIIGSLPFLSGISTLYLCLTEKSKKYGNVFAFYIGSRYTVVLSGHDTIREALVKHAHEYSGRGETYFESNVWTDGGRGVVFKQASEEQRRSRNDSILAMKRLGFGNTTVVERVLNTEITHLLEYINNLEGKTWHPWSIMQKCTMNVMYSILFGSRFQYDDPLGSFLQSNNDELMRCQGPIYDVFPWLAYTPHFKRKFDSCRSSYSKILNFHCKKIEECTSNLETVGSDENFVKEYIRIVGQDCDKRELAVILRDLFLAGSDTVAGQMNWMMILMANNQDAQKRIQEEIDSIMPRDQLPSLSDRTRLSYVEAAILELMRIRTSVPLSLMHETLADTRIGDYKIPSKSLVIVNLWSAHTDPEIWKEPEEFRPERFLDSDGNIINRDLVITFSLGKRSCLGEVLARQELFLVISALLHQFHILPPEGASRVEYGIDYATTMTPTNHLVRLVPRDS